MNYPEGTAIGLGGNLDNTPRTPPAMGGLAPPGKQNQGPCLNGLPDYVDSLAVVTVGKRRLESL